MIPGTARATAEGRLTERCVITRPGADTYSDGSITPGAGTPVWAGPCSLGRPESPHDSMNGGDERTVPQRTLRIPAAVVGVQVGDVATVTGRGTYTVTELDDRPDPVLRHLTVVNSVDAPGIPR